MIMEKSVELNIDLNAKHKYGRTAFQFALEKKHLDIVEMFMQKSAEFNINVN